MHREERAIVHLVDVIAGENQNEARIMRANNIEILVHGIGRAAIPLTTDALRGRQNFHEFACAGLEPGPAVYQVTNQ